MDNQDVEQLLDAARPIRLDIYTIIVVERARPDREGCENSSIVVQRYTLKICTMRVAYKRFCLTSLGRTKCGRRTSS